MYQRILVAYEGAAFSGSALRQGADLARLCKAELHLLAVAAASGDWALALPDGPNDVWGIEEQNMRRSLDSAAKDLGKHGINVVTSIRLGDPGVEIITYAHEMKADLVVLGHSDKGLFARWLEGSVGARLFKTLPCSLLIAVGST
jgi:nucleotide-binding universal stress UspA family protein